ncbi:MAG: tRNA pseudouridine(55) synthase TruB [Candidatus Dormibacteria bacterium]
MTGVPSTADLERIRVTGGVLSLNKPRGDTSFAAVRDVRRILNERRVGHAGTLDPMAQGLLPICVGRTTRLVDFFHQQSKTYRCVVRLGERSDTQDTEGTVTAGSDASTVSPGAVEAALAEFVGEIEQIPPMHSAVHHEGQRLYEIARRGEEVERKPRRVRIHDAQILEVRPGRVTEATIEVTSGTGAYMRVLAADLGERLGVGGLLGWLERTRYGVLDVVGSVTLDELRAAADPWTLLRPADVAVEFLPRVDLGPPLATQVRRGQGVFLPRSDSRPQGSSRAHTADGELFAIGEVAGTHFRPTKVLTS